MKNYRITAYINRIHIPYMDDFKKAKKYHRKHGVDIEFVFKHSDVTGYQSVLHTRPDGFTQYVLGGAENLVDIDSASDATLFLFDMNEWATEQGSAFPLKLETPNGSCRLVKGKPFICVGTYITDHRNGQTWIQIAHEIMHSYVIHAFLAGTSVTDVMDTYRENSNPDSPTGNFAEQWKLLKLYMLE